MLTFPIPASLQGQALSDELAAAGLAADVYIRGDELVIDGPTDRAAVKRILDAHVPPTPATSDPDAELVAAITAATTLAQLKDALIGKGRSAVVAGRDKNR